MTEDACVADALHYEQVYGQAAPDEHQQSSGHRWSGKANSTLVREVSGLPPGTALDAGAGEGGDACWLAARGWTVTGVELSGVALERAAARAHDEGLAVTWVQHDLTRTPAPQTYDLVTAHYLHIGRTLRPRLWANLAASVAPGGTLLVVGHDPGSMPRPEMAEMCWSPREVAAALGDGWTIDVCDVRPHPAPAAEGREHPVSDAVLRAHRRG